MEAIGTFSLVFTVGAAVGRASPLAVLGAGANLIMMTYGRELFGGHYNPAVTLAVLMRHQIPSHDAVTYLVAQVGAGLLAAAAVARIIDPTRLASTALMVLSGQTLLVAFVVELMFSFALCFVLLNGTICSNRPAPRLRGLAIGFSVVAGALLAAAFELDARIDAGPALWVYLMAQVVTGPAAAISFLALNPTTGD